MLIKIVQNGIESDWFQLTKKAHRELIKRSQKRRLYIARSGGKVASDARKAIEQQTGVPVITSKNAAQLNQVVTNLIEATDEIVSKDKSKE
ncbi:MAG: hypothetical protein ACLU3I_16185 [Acutalibacteraceae bacterium]